jgi:uncharacterized membrane protein YadS
MWPQPVTTDLAASSACTRAREKTFLLTFAGVGLHFDLRRMRRSGFRPFLAAALALAVVAVTSLVEVLIAFRLIGL